MSWVIFENKIASPNYPNLDPVRVENIVALKKEFEIGQWLKDKVAFLKLSNPSIDFKTMEATEESKRKSQVDAIWSDYVPGKIGPFIFFYARWVQQV